MLKVSVIVPVYNTEKYLDMCLSSLVKQNFKDFEIIVINDGSTDNSKVIIDSYQKLYPELIKAHSFKNRGISKTRNYGISKARGKYISFIDSDDYVDVNFLQEMYQRIEKTDSDICVCDYFTVNEKDEIKKFNLPAFRDGNIKNNPQLLLNINPSPWNKLYKKSLFKNLSFEDIKYEDLLLLPQLICSADKITKLNKPLNYYRIREYSETNIVDEHVFDILTILSKLNAYFKKEGMFDNNYKEIEYFNIYRITIYVIQQKYQKKYELRNKFIDEAFNFIDSNFPNWRKNSYYRKRNVFKRMIESNKFLSKLYVNLNKR